MRAADPRISGIESAEYVDVMAEGAVVTTTGIRTAGRETALLRHGLRHGRRRRRHPDRLRVLGRPRARRARRGPTAAAEAADRATRLLGATKPPSERLTVVLDPWVTAQFLGILGYTLDGEAVLKGRSLFADRLGDEVASPLVTLVDDPTDPDAFTATETDGEGLATRRNVAHRGRRAAAVRAQRLHAPAGRARSPPARRCGAASRARPASAAWRRRCSPAPPPRPSCSPASATGCWCRTSPACTRASTRSAATSPPAPRGCASAAASWPSRCASSPSPPPSRGCSRT